MKVKAKCKTCGSTVTVERFCKKSYGECCSIEDYPHLKNDESKPYCLPCTRKEGPMKSKKQIGAEKVKREEYEKELKKLQEEYNIYNPCKHPAKFVTMKHEYSWGDHYTYYCKVCNKEWTDSYNQRHSSLGD